MMPDKLVWSYGVTTVPERFTDLLPRTLSSLALAGFDAPRLFIDGIAEIPSQYRELRGYEATLHYPKLRTFGNWITALWELYLRNPIANRYAIFQDDLVTYKNLRQYLDECDYPKHGYWNLYTFPENQKPYKGWYLSNQQGKGAVGLVLNNEATRKLLATEYMVDRPLCPKRGHSAIDGGIVSAFAKAGWQEWVHNPSLLQHTGDKSSMGNGYQPKAENFMGEQFDALELTDRPVTAVSPEPIRSKPGPNRIGLVGYNCATGLGELNRQIATYSEIDVWLCKPHPNYATEQTHPGVDLIICQQGQRSKIEKFLKSVDTVVFCEQPYYTELVEMALQAHKRIVCVPMMEWVPAGSRGWPQQCDLLLCPTKHCYDQFASVVPCIHFPWPVDTERFKFVERKVCNKFLYIGGHGGFGGRKGIAVMQRAKQIWPEMPLAVRCQESTQWPKDTEILSPTHANSSLYDIGDVLIAPHSVDGLGLEPMEAMSCGMPVITTDGLPWNEIPSIGKISANTSKRRVRRPVDWYTPDPQSLVTICKELLGQDVAKQSQEARHWAEERSWNRLAGEFNRIVRSSTATIVQATDTKSYAIP